MKKNNNILKQWWYSYLVIPFFSIGAFFIPGWEKTDKSMLIWMLSFVFAIIAQLIFIIKFKIKYKQIHYNYILITFILTIFISFAISKFAKDIVKYDWLNNIFFAIISFLIIFIIKIIVWYIMIWNEKQLIKKDQKIKNLNLEVKALKKENEQIKNQDEKKQL